MKDLIIEVYDKNAKDRNSKNRKPLFRHRATSSKYKGADDEEIGRQFVRDCKHNRPEYIDIPDERLSYRVIRQTPIIPFTTTRRNPELA